MYEYESFLGYGGPRAIVTAHPLLTFHQKIVSYYLMPFVSLSETESICMYE